MPYTEILFSKPYSDQFALQQVQGTQKDPAELRYTKKMNASTFPLQNLHFNGEGVNLKIRCLSGARRLAWWAMLQPWFGGPSLYLGCLWKGKTLGLEGFCCGWGARLRVLRC